MLPQATVTPTLRKAQTSELCVHVDALVIGGTYVPYFELSATKMVVAFIVGQKYQRVFTSTSAIPIS